MAILGLIPARGNSKGIPDKNLKEVGGVSLLARAARGARESKFLAACFLSTDSEKIAEAGKKEGLLVPFLRPPAIAEDATPMIEVLRHFLTWSESNLQDKIEAITLLQPTSPFRTAFHIDQAINLWKNKSADTVVSVVRIPHQFHPDSSMKMLPDGTMEKWNHASPSYFSRQEKPPAYARNGPAVLVIGADVIRSGTLYGPKTIGFPMSEGESMDIDTPLDLWLANELDKKTKQG